MFGSSVKRIVLDVGCRDGGMEGCTDRGMEGWRDIVALVLVCYIKPVYNFYLLSLDVTGGLRGH